MKTRTASKARMSDSFLTVPNGGLTREPGRAIWRQIEEILAAAIAGGALPPDSQLPSELELADRFNVNRHTVRQALGALAQRGMLLVEHGRGSFVVRDAIEYALGPRTRFSENLLLQGRQPGTELITATEEAASAEVARQLKIRLGAKVVRLDTLRQANGRPVSLGHHYFPARQVPGLAQIFARYLSVTRALKEFGIVDYHRVTTRIGARLPQGDEAHRLRLSRTQPLLVTESVNAAKGGRPIEYVIGLFAADRIQLIVNT